MLFVEIDRSSQSTPAGTVFGTDWEVELTTTGVLSGVKIGGTTVTTTAGAVVHVYDYDRKSPGLSGSYVISYTK